MRLPTCHFTLCLKSEESHNTLTTQVGYFNLTQLSCCIQYSIPPNQSLIFRSLFSAPYVVLHPCSWEAIFQETSRAKAEVIEPHMFGLRPLPCCEYTPKASCHRWALSSAPEVTRKKKQRKLRCPTAARYFFLQSLNLEPRTRARVCCKTQMTLPTDTTLLCRFLQEISSKTSTADLQCPRFSQRSMATLKCLTPLGLNLRIFGGKRPK